MAFKPMQVNFSSNTDIKIWPEKSSLLNGGLNLVDKEYKLPESQTPKVKNMWFYNGELGIRWGQEYLNGAETVEPICWGAYKYPFMGYYIKHCGTKLYKQDISTGVSTSIYSGLTAAKSSITKFNGKLYIKQAGKYIVWDGTTASAVVPYIPTVIINRTPTGGGNLNEDYNRIGAGFKNSFNGDNAALAYTLTDSGLDATTVTCTVDGVAKVEGTDFTVNRTTGVVTFSVAPASGTNNVIIIAHKTVQTDIDSVLNCLYAIPFGGQNDNRLFVGGNGTGYFYYTGITASGIDATYFAYNNYNIIGLTDENITGFGKHYDTLCILKEREIYGETYAFDGTTGAFNTFPITSEIGCDCPNTIQNVSNNLVFTNSHSGVYVLVGTSVNSQRNVFPVSRNVNPQLLAESNLKDASSLNLQQGTLNQYWLCVNDNVYVWDYATAPYYNTGDSEESAKRLSWWYFDNINAAEWIIDDNLLYIKRDTGITVKFHKEYDTTQFYDFGEIIPAIYRYPFRLMGGGIYEFSVLNGWISVRGDIKTAYKVTYFTSDDFNGDPATENINVGSFSWDEFGWPNFVWSVMGPLFNWQLSPYEKNIRYFGVEFENTKAGTDMNISGMEWRYTIGKLIR